MNPLLAFAIVLTLFLVSGVAAYTAGYKTHQTKTNKHLKTIALAYYKMADTAITSKDDDKWSDGYRAGFNACYRRVEQAMLGDLE